MRKYNRRILTALVVAYKKGIINKKPLNRWLNFKEISYRLIKYLSYIILFTALFIVIDRKIFNHYLLNEYVYIGNYFIERSRIISGIIIGILALNLYKLYKYLSQIYIVKKAMKKYKSTDDNVEILNSVTFKINV